jgi:ATP-dependent DNA helicase RecG
VPHFLSLSATPIPRSLQLAFFGELSISRIKTKPANRKPILTKLVSADNRAEAYNLIKTELQKGRQAFVITPLIEPSDKLGVKSVKSELENITQVFGEYKVGIMHGKLSAKEREATMEKFLQNQLHILVSTSVVEVGVDVPNASVMVIEGADRFGLAQLHQFRGRVGRAEHQSHCFLFTENQNPETLKRLAEFTKMSDGFAVAELDLKQRGFGQLFGETQSGWDFKYFNLDFLDLIPKAKEDAEELLKNDPNLAKFPLLKAKISNQLIHLE